MQHTVLVTGASRGIGLELARQLSERGERVVATARSPDSARALQELEVEIVPLDVTDPDSVAALAEHLEGRPLDLLIHNSGRGGGGSSVESLDLEEFEELLRVNCLGPMRVTRALLPLLRAGERRAILHLSSRLGSIELADGGRYAYRSSKTALNMCNRLLAQELAAEGFTCVVVHPGWVRTDMGGPQAPLSVEESARDLVERIDQLESAQNGCFLNHDGSPLPW